MKMITHIFFFYKDFHKYFENKIFETMSDKMFSQNVFKFWVKFLTKKY